MRTIFESFAVNAKIADWLADGAVWVELLSGLVFPDKQGKNREKSRFSPVLEVVIAKNAAMLLRNSLISLNIGTWKIISVTGNLFC